MKIAMIAIALVVLSLIVGFFVMNNYEKEYIGDANAVGADGLPVIFEVIESRDFSDVEALIDAGADIESKGFGGQTPVLASAKGDLWRVALLLLQKGANPLTTDHIGLTLPYLAQDSRVSPDSTEGAALAAVKTFLEERGLDDKYIFDPQEVTRMVAEGSWPPKVIE